MFTPKKQVLENMVHAAGNDQANIKHVGIYEFSLRTSLISPEMVKRKYHNEAISSVNLVKMGTEFLRICKRKR